MAVPQAKVRTGSSNRRLWFTWQRAYAAAVLTVALLIVDVVISHGFSSIQLVGITSNALPLALAAIGETFVMLTNGIDLSIGSVITVTNVTVAVLAAHGLGDEGVVVALAIGAVAGLANGLIINYARIAPLIATLATSSIWTGIALIILPVAGGTFPSWLSGWTVGTVGSVPVSAIWLGVLMVVGFLMLRRTKFGINVQALGGSESSSWTVGIRVVRVRTLAYVASGICSALAGIVLCGLTQSGDPTIGAFYLLQAIAAVVIGGTPLIGGVGTLVGSVLGAVVLSLVSTVLLVTGWPVYLQYVVTGAIVIAALLVQARLSKHRTKLVGPSRIAAETDGA
jgi:ribose transport system permease protein